MKLHHSQTGKQIPKTAKEALLLLPASRKLFNAMSPEAKEVALKGMQRKLDQVNKA